MKKTYTRKHICEALTYWRKQLKKLKRLNESSYLPIIKDYSKKLKYIYSNSPEYVIISVSKSNPSDIGIYPVDKAGLEEFLDCIDTKFSVHSVIEEEYPDNIYTEDLSDVIISIFPIDKVTVRMNGVNDFEVKNFNITQDKVGEIGQEIEQNISKAFTEAYENETSIIPGDPIVTDDNIDELQEDVLDKLFGGGNNPEKNDIGPQNAYNLYGDFVPCDFKTFEAFYNYVKKNGY